MQDSEDHKNKATGLKYFSLGGGNGNGDWTQAVLTNLDQAVSAGSLQGYDGIAYDIEEGDSHLGNFFQASFANSKKAGLKVMVTVSHSAPYGFLDSPDLMNAFFHDGNIDYLSPQLYTSGYETANDYTTTYGVQWTSYASAKAQVVPSIVRASMYSDAQQYFLSQGVTTDGYIQWAPN